MSLGALAFLVGNQIGKTQKSNYERNLEEERKKEERANQAQIDKELRDYQTFLKKQEVQFQYQKDFELYKQTELKNEELANRLQNMDLIEAEAVLSGMIKDKVQIQSILNLISAKQQEAQALGEVALDLKVKEFQTLSPLRIEEEVEKFKALTQPTADRAALVEGAKLDVQFASEKAKLQDTEFQNLTLDNKINELEKTELARGRAAILNKLAEYSNKELQELVREVSAGKIKSDTAAQGQANTVALIEKLGNKELQALELLISSNKIISDSKATSTARIAAMKAELGDKELQKLLLSAEEDKINQQYTLKLQDEMIRLTSDDYQALLNSTKASQILSEQAAKDKALITTLSNKELQDKLLTVKRLEGLQEGDIKVINELKMLDNKKLQGLLLDAKVNEERALQIVRNVAELDLYTSKKFIDNQDAQTAKDIAEAENIEKTLKISIPLGEFGEDFGEDEILEVPFYKNFEGKTQQAKNEAPLKHMELMVSDGTFSKIMQFGTQDQIKFAQRKLYSTVAKYLDDTASSGSFESEVPIVLQNFGGFTEDSAAEAIVTQAQNDENFRAIEQFAIDNNIPSSNLTTVTYVAGARVKTAYKVMTSEHKEVFDKLMNFRLTNNLTTQERLDAGEALKYIDDASLTFYTEFLKPDDKFSAGYDFSDLQMVQSFLNDGIRMPKAIRNKLLVAGRAAGFTNAAQYITAISAGINTNKKPGVKMKYGAKKKLLEDVGLDYIDINAKANSSMMLERALFSFISTWEQEDIDSFKTDPQNAELLQGVVADADATSLAGAPLSAINMIFSKLPNAAKGTMKRFGLEFTELIDAETGNPVSQLKSSGTEADTFAGFGEVLRTNQLSNYSSLNLNDASDRAEIKEEFERQRLINPSLIAKIARNANKNIGEVTEEDYYNSEIAARQRNQQAYDEALVRYNTSAADSDARIGAKRDLLKFVIAYQYASLLQGGTGGRTISDQDVENMLTALNAGELADPQGAITSSLEVLKQARLQREISTAYLSGDKAEMAGAHFFEKELAADVKFVYNSGDFAYRIKKASGNGKGTSQQSTVTNQAFSMTSDGVVIRSGEADNQTISTKQLVQDFIDGKPITVTEDLLEQHPELKEKYSVGQTILNESKGSGT
jgi:hypothetical protein